MTLEGIRLNAINLERQGREAEEDWHALSAELLRLVQCAQAYRDGAWDKRKPMRLAIVAPWCTRLWEIRRDAIHGCMVPEITRVAALLAIYLQSEAI